MFEEIWSRAGIISYRANRKLSMGQECINTTTQRFNISVSSFCISMQSNSFTQSSLHYLNLSSLHTSQVNIQQF